MKILLSEKSTQQKTTSFENTDPSRHEVWMMFDRIAHRYDLLNHLLSMGQDIIWREKVSKHLKNIPDQHVLDLATGTADLLLTVYQKNPLVKTGIGLDLAEKMLDIGRHKISERNLNGNLSLMAGDAMNIPFPENSFDAVMIAFGIRNVINVQKSLGEMNRILKKGGRTIILEFSLPQNRIIRSLYLFYFRKVLPKIGALISGDANAYKYLNETVEAFPYGDDFCDLMLNAGFKQVKSTPLTFGIAAIYQGDKE
jgi:demethylmenaquinone methyltransferase/2-methoxy-6-polyprenyl-1,4-benzoquinol methylase